MTELAQFQFDFENATETGVIERPIPKYSKQDERNFILDMMDTLTAPILTFTTNWADAIPQDLKASITQARLISVMKKEQTATIPEVVAYIMTRSYEAPMPREWTNIYIWCGAQYMKQYRGSEMPTGICPDSLNDYEQSLLKGLRDWIYRKRREVVKSCLKSAA